MKFKILAFFLGLFSTSVISSEILSPISNVNVIESKVDSLSIQNTSNESVEIDIYGEVFLLKPASGVVFNCGSYTHLELKFKNIMHDYFEVHCRSKVLIN